MLVGFKTYQDKILVLTANQELFQILMERSVVRLVLLAHFKTKLEQSIASPVLMAPHNLPQDSKSVMMAILVMRYLD